MPVSHPPLQDPEAFSKFYDRTQIIIFRFIYGLHGGPIEEVEDLTCDTFLRAWKSRIRFSGDDHDALCWLFVIARRLVIDAHRHKKAHDEESFIQLDEINFHLQANVGSETPEEQATAHEQFKHLWYLLQKLPDEKREMIVLRYLVGWKVKEIADYLHKEENTVSVSIKRCLSQLRQEWSTEDNRR